MNTHRSTLTVTTLLAGLFLASDFALTVAQAQIEEIVVTTRKREERLSELPLSVSALSWEDIQNRGVEHLLDLAHHVPGLDFETTGSIAGSRPIIRGLNQQTRVGDEVNVATFVDGVYTPGFSGSTSIGFDGLERVEVAKGPQSALQGRNSFAGSINYITRRPGNEVEFGGRATAATEGKWDASAYFALPLVENGLAVRIDAGVFNSGGTHTNSINGERLNDQESGFVRLNVVFNPNDSLDGFFSLSYRDDKISPSPRAFVDDDDPRLIGKPAAVSPFERGESTAAGICRDGLGGEIDCGIPRLFDGEVTSLGGALFADPLGVAGDRNSLRAVLELAWDLETVTVTSLTGLQDRKAFTFSDADTSPEGTSFSGIVGRRTQALRGGPVLAQSLTGSDEDRYEISQDLRVQSNGDNTLDWLAGVYFSSEDFDDNRKRCSDPPVRSRSTIYTQGCPPVLDEEVNRKNTFRSVYGAFDFDASEKLNLAFELRYTSEKKEFNEMQNVFPIRDPSSDDYVPPQGRFEDTFTFLTPRGVISYQPNEDTLLYAVAARGAKSGGFNSGSICVGPNDPGPDCSVAERRFEIETNWTYEAGAKINLFGAAQVNASLFYTDWKDQQLIAGTELATSSSPIVRNIEGSTVQGLELEAFVTLTEAISINLGYAFTDTEYGNAFSTATDDLEGVCDILECAVMADDMGEGPITTGEITGNQFSSVSRHSGNAGIAFVSPFMNSGYDFFGRADAVFRGKRYIDDSNTGYIGRQVTVNVRFGLQRENLSVQGFCSNVTDDDTPIRTFLLRNFLGVPHRVIHEREGRKCGVSFSFSY